MFDIIEKLDCGSLIQHGKYNDRIYLLKASPKDISTLPIRLIDFAKKHNYSKIFAKIEEGYTPEFFAAGFVEEARIPSMYQGVSDACFLAFYCLDFRKIEDDLDLYIKNIQLALDKKDTHASALNPFKYHIRSCNSSDIPVMAEIYKKVFPTYPFPIHDRDYLFETMDSNVDYFCVEEGHTILALASAEKDIAGKYAEMTDFATLPESRAKGFAFHLLNKMEKSIKKQGYLTAFTIARAASAGMNITFARSNYAFGGKLKNNTNISGKIESMNIWYKKI